MVGLDGGVVGAVGDVGADELADELDDDDALVVGVELGLVRSMPVPICCFVAIGSLGWCAR